MNAPTFMWKPAVLLPINSADLFESSKVRTLLGRKYSKVDAALADAVSTAEVLQESADIRVNGVTAVLEVSYGTR